MADKDYGPLLDALASMLTPADAGRLLGITAERVRQFSDEGRLPVVRTPLGRLYERADIEHLIKQRADIAQLKKAHAEGTHDG